MGQIKHNIKKYRYYLVSYIKGMVDSLVGTLKTFTYDYNKFVGEYDAVNLLPYPTNWQKIKGHNRLFCEIGPGHGELIQYLAKKNTEDMYIGFEITSEYSRRANKIVKELDNAYVFKAQAYDLIPKLFAKESLDGIYVLFPDPWHKKRHHKRRPLVEDWFRVAHKLLKPGGFIYFATDWEEYYDFVERQMDSVTDIYDISKGIYNPQDAGLTDTHYYLKWKEMGRKFEYIRIEKR